MISKFILIFILLLLLLILEPNYKSNPDPYLLISYILIFIFILYLHFRSNKEKNWFRLDLIFILGFALVHFQWPLMYSLNGITPKDFSLFWSTANYMQYLNYGTWLSTIGISAWTLGFAILKKQEVENDKFKYSYYNYKKFFYFTLILFIIFVLTAGQQYLSGAVYKGETTVATGAGISVYFQLLFSYSIIILSAIVIINMFKFNNLSLYSLIKKTDPKFILLFSVTILLFLFVGDRGGALQPTFALLIMYGYFIKEISGKKFLLIIIIGALIMTIVGLGRADKSQENILLAGSNNLKIDSGYEITLELANSARTLYKSLSYVPEFDDFYYGKLWTAQILANIPLAQSLYMSISNDKYYELDSAQYITYITRGRFSTWGEGTSLIADIYLNFGIYGVIVFMTLLGLFFKKVTNELKIKSNIYWIVTGAILAAYAFYLGRGGLLYPLRPILWSTLLVLIFIRRK